MAIYIIIGLVIGVFALIETFLKVEAVVRKKIHFLFFILVTIWAIFFVGFRECGFDFDNYYSYFHDFNTISWKVNADYDSIEYGYALINYLIGDFRLVLIFMAIVTIILQFKFIYKYSPLPFVSLFLLLGVIFYPSIMGQFRQALAMSLVLWAFVNKKNKLFFFGIILLASFFHISSLIALIALFIPDKLFSTRIYIYFLIVALILNLTVKTYLVSMSTFLPALMSDKIDFYISTEDFVFGLNLAMLLRIIVFAIFLFNRNKIISSPKGSFFLNLYFASLLIYLSLGSIPQLAGRGSIYFYYLEFILVPILIVKSNNFLRFSFFLFFIAISISRQFSFFNEWHAAYIPYKNSILSFFGL